MDNGHGRPRRRLICEKVDRNRWIGEGKGGGGRLGSVQRECKRCCRIRNISVTADCIFFHLKTNMNEKRTERFLRL